MEMLISAVSNMAAANHISFRALERWWVASVTEDVNH